MCMSGEDEKKKRLSLSGINQRAESNEQQDTDIHSRRASLKRGDHAITRYCSGKNLTRTNTTASFYFSFFSALNEEEKKETYDWRRVWARGKKL